MSTIDRAALDQFLRDVGPVAAKRLAGVFAAETRRRVEAALRLAPAGPGPDLRREAHSLKSAARTYGAAGIAQAAQALEEACNANRAADVAPLARALAETVARDLSEFEAVIAATS
ncbi:MAG: Hpt domain-containing protein [Pseudomonadota bacterium]